MKRIQIVSYLEDECPVAWVANTLGVSISCVNKVRRELRAGRVPGTRGRPRKRTHPAEACARFLMKKAAERRQLLDYDGVSALELAADSILLGAWREFL